MKKFREIRPIEEVFREMIGLLEERSGKSAGLARPATPKDIARAEKSVGQSFPRDVMALYRIANGQTIGGSYVPLFPGGYDFLSLDGLVSQWTLMNDLWKNEEVFRFKGEPQGAVQGCHWTPDWVPIAGGSGGDLVCLDFAPTRKGISAQVIEFLHGDTPRRHLALDVNSYLGWISDGLKTGSVSYHAEWGVFVDNSPVSWETWAVESGEVVPEFVYVPDHNFSSVVRIKAQKTATVGEWIRLRATRQSGPWEKVLSASIDPQQNWYLELPETFEQEVAANLAWQTDPPNAGRFDVEVPGLDRITERRVSFERAGTYKIWGHSSSPCDAKSNVLTINVR